MREDELKQALHQLARLTDEPVRPELAEEIRHQIPRRLVRHRVNWNSVGIIIDLRLSRAVAAAAIIVVMLVWGTFLGGWNTSAGQVYKDSVLLLKYGIAGEKTSREQVTAGLEDLRARLARQGKTVTFYGPSGDRDDKYLILMYWPTADDQYRVILNDLSVWTVSPKVLVQLQAYMLNKHLGQ